MLRERLLHGLLALDTESMRAEGIGQLLGRVVETEALESLALGGGLMAAAGAFELVTGAVVARARRRRGLAAAAARRRWLRGRGAVLAAGVQRALARWSAERIALTHDLVERMVGQRTLVAQQAARAAPRRAGGGARALRAQRARARPRGRRCSRSSCRAAG